MILRHILHYLIQHPDAKDTVQGVLRWWLTGGIMQWEEAAVQDALDQAVVRAWPLYRTKI